MKKGHNKKINVDSNLQLIKFVILNAVIKEKFMDNFMYLIYNNRCFIL